MRTRNLLLILTLLLGSTAIACGDDAAPNPLQRGNNNSRGDGDEGDGDGDEEEGDGDRGDGDGDEGDGDGDRGDGDGDADGDGDGDGDSGDGDGDGDGDAGDGDGDGDAGDGDGDGDGDAGDGDGDGVEVGDAPTAESASKPGPYKHKSYGEADGLRNGPNYGSQTLWMPENGTPPYAAVAIVPGWVSSEADIADWGPFLASHGIVALTIGTNNPPADLPAQRKDALLDALETIKAENTRSGGPLNGKLDLNRLGVMGWSMGGGGAVLAGLERPELKAVIGLAAWGEIPAPDMKPATMLIAGGNLPIDSLAGGQSQATYDSMKGSNARLIYQVEAGDHWVANNPAHENGSIGRFGLSWLKTYLVGDSRYKQFLSVKPAGASDFRFENL